MKTINDGASLPRHLEDDDLISFLDGELSRTEQDCARTHLEGCWNCRSRLLAVQNSIESFLRMRKQVLPPDVPPADTAISQFRRRLSRHKHAPATLSQLPRWLQMISPLRARRTEDRSSLWSYLLPDFSLVGTYKKTVLATLAVLVVVALLIDPLGLNHVSAGELLTRADSYELLNEMPAGKVVRAKVQLDLITLSNHMESKIGEVELTQDSLTSSVYVLAQHASGVTQKQTVADRDKLKDANFFANDFPMASAKYLAGQSWFPQVSVSAYRRLVAARGFRGDEEAFTARRGDAYELHHPFASAHPSGITETVLLLNAQTYAPRAISIFTTDGNQRFEYRLTRTAFERVERTPEVAKLFEGRPTVVSITTKPETRNPAPDPLKTELATSNSKLEAMASAELEVEVLRLLNQAGADLGEQVSVSRSANGPARVSGIVESDQRKREILQALQPVATNPAVRIEVKTVAEAMAKHRDKRDTSRPATVEGVEVAADTFPAYQELRARMSDEEARVFAARTVSRSHSAMRHAWALKRLMSQFSGSDLATLQPDAHAKWIALIKSHAREFERETSVLRQQLEPIFSSGSGNSGAGEIRDDAELMRTVERLIALASTNYEIVRSAFTVTRESNAFSAIKSPQFWQSLRSAEALAARIGRQ